MKHVSKDHPEIVFHYLDILIEYIHCKAPRVKWGVPESIGNFAQKYHGEVEKAIPNLLLNTREKALLFAGELLLRWLRL